MRKKKGIKGEKSKRERGDGGSSRRRRRIRRFISRNKGNLFNF